MPAILNKIPAGAHTSCRPWDSPYAIDRGIPWDLRKYVFDWTVGRITVAPCGDGHASNGGWKVRTSVDPLTGKATFLGAEADDDAYKAQNRLGFPLLTYEQAEKVFKTSEREGICQLDALFSALDLDELDLSEAEKTSCAGSREVFTISRSDVKKNDDRQKAAKAKLAELTSKKK